MIGHPTPPPPTPPLELVNFLALNGWEWEHRNFNYSAPGPHHGEPMYVATRPGCRAFGFGAWETVEYLQACLTNYAMLPP